MEEIYITDYETFDTFEMFNSYKKSIKKHPLYKGFVLLREYPGNRNKVGDFEPYTSGDFLKYPEIWSPVLHDDIARDNKINDILDESIDTLESN